MIGDYVYVGAHGNGPRGNLWAFNPGTGKQVWHFPDGLYSTVVAAGHNHLVVAGRTHALHAAIAGLIRPARTRTADRAG